MVNKKIQDLAKAIREKLGLSCVEMSKALKCSQASYWRIENEGAIPKRFRIEKLIEMALKNGVEYDLTKVLWSCIV